MKFNEQSLLMNQTFTHFWSSPVNDLIQYQIHLICTVVWSSWTRMCFKLRAFTFRTPSTYRTGLKYDQFPHLRNKVDRSIFQITGDTKVNMLTFAFKENTYNVFQNAVTELPV